MRTGSRVRRMSEPGLLAILVTTLALLVAPSSLRALTEPAGGVARLRTRAEVALVFSCPTASVPVTVEAAVDPAEVVEGDTTTLSLTVGLPAWAALPAPGDLWLSFPMPEEVAGVPAVALPDGPGDRSGVDAVAWFADAGALTLVLTPDRGPDAIIATARATIQFRTGVAPVTVAFASPDRLTVVDGAPDGADEACAPSAAGPALVSVVVAQATTPTTGSTTTTAPTTTTTGRPPPTTTTTTPSDPAVDGDAPSPDPLAPSEIPYLPPPVDPYAASHLVTADSLGAQALIDRNADELARSSAEVAVLEARAAELQRRERRLEADRASVAVKLDHAGHDIGLLAADAYVSAVDAYVSLAVTSSDVVMMGTALEQGLAQYQHLLDRQAEVVAQLSEVAGSRADGQHEVDGALADQQDLQAQVDDGRFQLATFQNGGSLAVSGFNFPVAGEHDFSDTWLAPRSGGRQHQGTDIFAAEGTPLRAVERGVLADVGTNTLGGTKLWLVGESGTHYYYAHLSAFAEGVADGLVVDAGEIVGFVGHTGNARTTPPHLHFEVHPGGGDAIDGYPMLLAADGVVTGAATVLTDPPDTATTATTATTAATSTSTTSTSTTTATVDPTTTAGGRGDPPPAVADEHPTSIEGWGGAATADDPLTGPGAVAVASDGTVFVADTGHDRVVVLDADGGVVRSWGGTGGTEGRFRQPQGVAVAGDGTVYVADTGNNRIQHLTAEGAVLDTWGGTGRRDGRLNEPTGVAVGGEGRVYVADRLNNRVQVFEPDGTRVDGWGRFGAAPGRFANPYGITVGPDGDVYVADTFNNRVQRFTAGGHFVDEWSEQMRRPYAVAVTERGELIVADRSARAIRQYDADGRRRAVWGLRGTAAGAMGHPQGLALTGDGRLYVADTGNDRIQAFTWR